MALFENVGSRDRAAAELGSVAEPIVSIQRMIETDPQAAHLAWGRLVGRDQVVVAGPFEWLSEAEAGVQVILASSRLHGPGFVERIQIDKISLVSMQPDQRDAVALVQLTHPSNHEVETASVARQAFEELLGATPDVKAALESLGILRSDIYSLDPAAVLAPVREWEQERRNSLLQKHFSQDPGEIGFFWCLWFGGCRPDRGRWW